MVYLRIRGIAIDVLPDGDPFIHLTVEKVVTDAGEIIQVIGNFDRISKRLHDVVVQDVGTIADDGVIDGMELYTLIAQMAYQWVMEKHGGMIDASGRLVI